MTLNVHIHHLPAGWSAETLEDLQGRLDGPVVFTTGDRLPDPARYHVLIAGRPSRVQLDASPNLRAVIVPFAGPPEETRKLLADYPHLTLHNLHHNAIPTAEMALALLLAAARFIPLGDRLLRQGNWAARYDKPPEMVLHGQTALILGFGAIGQHVARLCQAFGMRVLAVRRNPAAPLPADLTVEVSAPDRLHDLLPQADVLVVTLPLSASTRGLIGARELALLPRHALLVNIGRGDVVDEEALYQALHSRRLPGAALDVWYRYPENEDDRAATLPSTYPFHELDNVVMSPHHGGAYGVPFTEQRRLEDLARLLNAAVNSEPIPNRFDLSAGY
ncbi:MAG: 2-hydroxyacid dehydrogenase [Caldilineales bacterium]